MTPQKAINILMLSPCYWLLDVQARKELVLEYCASFNAAADGINVPRKEDAKK